MANIPIPFEDINKNDCAFVDASSLAALSKVSTTLRSPLNASSAKMLIEDAQGIDEYGLKNILPTLEYFVIQDFLVADFSAIDSIQTYGKIVRGALNRIMENVDIWDIKFGDAEFDKDKELFNYFSQHILNEQKHDDIEKRKLLEICKIFPLRVTHIPVELSKKLIPPIYQFSCILKTLAPTIPWGQYGFGEDKGYHDTRDGFDESGFSHSHLGVERTLFYYEVSRSTGKPIVYHPNRNITVANINGTLIDAFRLVKKQLKNGFEIPVEIQASDIGVKLEIKQPALAMYIIRQAGKRGVSIAESLCDIRESKLASSFRKWLSQVHNGLIDDAISENMNALKMIKELEKTTDKWVKELDVESGVAFKRRKINISKLPKVGALLSVLGEISIKDPILNPKSYFTFITNWYK